MSIDQQQKFFMDLGNLLGELKADLELVVESETDILAPVIEGFKKHIEQAEAMESQINDIVLKAGLTKRGQ